MTSLYANDLPPLEFNKGNIGMHQLIQDFFKAREGDEPSLPRVTAARSSSPEDGMFFFLSFKYSCSFSLSLSLALPLSLCYH